jgi:hypothetical protein
LLFKGGEFGQEVARAAESIRKHTPREETRIRKERWS